jgi:hypothetical protein
MRKVRIRWSSGVDPIDWLPQFSLLRRAAFVPPLTPQRVRQLDPTGGFRSWVVPGDDFPHLAEVVIWMRLLLDTLALPFDEPREVMTSRAKFFFSLSRPRGAPRAAEGFKWSAPLTLKKEWQDLPPLYLNALEDLARLVAYWLRRNETRPKAIVGRS